LRRRIVPRRSHVANRSAAQGEVYRTIIDKVILASQTDFEEGGYTQETLQELKLVSDRTATPDLARLASSANLRLHQAWTAEPFQRCNMAEKWWEWAEKSGAEGVSA
jgi:hypothetical protein